MSDPRAGISGSTQLLFVAGSPVRQVKAPALLNAKFIARGIDAVCVPAAVAAENFEYFLSGVHSISNLMGVVITVPHKFAAAQHVSKLSQRGTLAGAANVLRRCSSGWEGDLLDGIGFVKGLEANGHKVEGADVFLAGAGGAGTAIAISLLEAGVRSIAIHDLEGARVSALLAKLSHLGEGRAYFAEGVSDTFTIAVNATPCGMAPGDLLPFDVSLLGSHCLVAEAIMMPALTKLLNAAATQGLRTHVGSHMLDGQLEAMADFFIDDSARLLP